LLTQLFRDHPWQNPIDFLATGTAQQLGTIIDYADRKFSGIDGMAVIFGTRINACFDVYDLLDRKCGRRANRSSRVAIGTYSREEVKEFVARGNVFFPDEVVFGNASQGVSYAQTNPAARFSNR